MTSNSKIAAVPKMLRKSPRASKVDERAQSYPQDLRVLVDDYLEQLQFTCEPGTADLEKAIRYSLLAGGKRIRPVLTLATSRALQLEVEVMLPTAAAVEMIHTNALIADDMPMMDNHTMRRGKPALHVVYGDDIAMLAGGALCSEAYRLIVEEQQGSPTRVLAVAQEIARMTGANGMVCGQYIDITGNGNGNGKVDVKSLRRMHELKTGTLIAAAVNCVLLLSEVNPPVAQQYRSFAAEIGVLFQIVDDILDVIGTEKSLGKKPGSDERLGKRTYVSCFGLERAQEFAAESHRTCRMALDEIGRHTGGSVADLEQITDYIYTRTI